MLLHTLTKQGNYTAGPLKYGVVSRTSSEMEIEREVYLQRAAATSPRSKHGKV